jgi:hypothetical protein
MTLHIRLCPVHLAQERLSICLRSLFVASTDPCHPPLSLHLLPHSFVVLDILTGPSRPLQAGNSRPAPLSSRADGADSLPPPRHTPTAGGAGLLRGSSLKQQASQQRLAYSRTGRLEPDASVAAYMHRLEAHVKTCEVRVHGDRLRLADAPTHAAGHDPCCAGHVAAGGAGPVERPLPAKQVLLQSRSGPPGQHAHRPAFAAPTYPVHTCCRPPPHTAALSQLTGRYAEAQAAAARIAELKTAQAARLRALLVDGHRTEAARLQGEYEKVPARNRVSYSLGCVVAACGRTGSSLPDHPAEHLSAAVDAMHAAPTSHAISLHKHIDIPGVGCRRARVGAPRSGLRRCGRDPACGSACGARRGAGGGARRVRGDATGEGPAKPAVPATAAHGGDVGQAGGRGW